MKKIDLSGITSETIAGVALLVLALINAVLQMFGYNTLPIADESISELISTLFLVGTALYNAYKNRNISSASQTAQEVTDALKNGTLAIEQVEDLLAQIRK